jgi:transposase
MEQPQEVADEAYERVWERVAAIDVAKATGVVCTRVPGDGPSGRRSMHVWTVNATMAAVTELGDHLRCQGIEVVTVESSSDYWRVLYVVLEAAGLKVQLVNARSVKDTADYVWLCKLNERGMLRRSFVPPKPARDLRALTRTRARLAQDQARHQARVEKILEDALLKISVVISNLFGASGRRFLDALVAGERSPAALAALGDKRLRATRAELTQALTGRFGDIHAFEIAAYLRLIDAICAEITALDEQIGQQLALVPGTAAACAACGLAGGGHAPGCQDQDVALLPLAERLDEISGIGAVNGRIREQLRRPDPASRPRQPRGHCRDGLRKIARPGDGGADRGPERGHARAGHGRAGRHRRHCDPRQGRR